MGNLKETLRHHVTGAIERGEAVAIVEQPSALSKLEKIENGTIRQINAYFRANDDSHKWPTCNKFNVTECAIRRLRKTGMYPHGGLEYFLALDAEISTIVNGAI